jgi:alpha-mannosidase
MGQHRFVYSLMPHGGDWCAAGVDREAEMMIRPAWSLPLERDQRGGLRGDWAPFTLRTAGGASVRIAAIKRAEEGGGLIMRLVECHGRAGSCEIQWKLPVRSVWPVDLLERPMDLPGFAHDAAAARTSIGLRRFQIVTLALDLDRPQP